MFNQGEAYSTWFSCLFPVNASLFRQVCISQARPIFFPCSNSVNHPIAVKEGGWNCFHTFSKTMQVNDDEGPWQVVQLIPGLAFIPNEDVVYWCTLLWNTFTYTVWWSYPYPSSLLLKVFPGLFFTTTLTCELALSLSLSKHCFALKQEGACNLNFVGRKEH